MKKIVYGKKAKFLTQPVLLNIFVKWLKRVFYWGAGLDIASGGQVMTTHPYIAAGCLLGAWLIDETLPYIGVEENNFKDLQQ